MRFKLSSFLVTLITLVGSGSHATEIVDRIAAVVNGEVVLISEVDKNCKLALEDIPHNLSNQETLARQTEIRKQALGALIDEMLIRQQVRERKIVVTDDEVEHELKTLMEYNKLNEQQLSAALINEGKTVEEFRKELKTQVEQRKLFGMDIQSKVQIGEKDIENYYRMNYVSGGTNEKVHASHILFALPENCSSEQEREMRAKAEKVLKQLRAGANFTELAKQYSDDTSSSTHGGDLGWFRRGDMLVSFEKAAFALSPGQISDVVRTRFGFHIIQIIERGSEGPRPLDDVRDEIRSRLYREKSTRVMRDWLDDLRRKSHIDIKL